MEDDLQDRRRELRAPADGVQFDLTVLRRDLPSGKGRRRWGRRRDRVDLLDLSWAGAAIKAPSDLELPVGATVALELDGARAWATVRNARQLDTHTRYGLEFNEPDTNTSLFFPKVLASGIELPGAPDQATSGARTESTTPAQPD